MTLAGQRRVTLRLGLGLGVLRGRGRKVRFGTAKSEVQICGVELGEHLSRRHFLADVHAAFDHATADAKPEIRLMPRPDQPGVAAGGLGWRERDLDGLDRPGRVQHGCLRPFEASAHDQGQKGAKSSKLHGGLPKLEDPSLSSDDCQ